MLRALPLSALAPLFLIAGCSGDSEQSCVTIPDPVEASACHRRLFDERAPTTEPAAYALIEPVPDPFAREAMVNSWLAKNTVANPDEARHLCGLVSSGSRAACERRAASPHLNKP